jgi:hypothetical protein
MENLNFLLTFLFYVLVASPICLVLHELGHAVMLLLLTKQKVMFQFGVRGTRREMRLGRVTVLLYFEPSALFFSRYFPENKAALTRGQDVAITLGGPLVSLSSTVAFGLLWQASGGGDPWTGLTIISLVNFLNSSIPRSYPAWQGAQAGIPNDGMQLMELLGRSRA